MDEQLKQFCISPSSEKFFELDDDVQIDLYKTSKYIKGNAVYIDKANIFRALNIVEYVDESYTCDTKDKKCKIRKKIGEGGITKAENYFIEQCNHRCKYEIERMQKAARFGPGDIAQLKTPKAGLILFDTIYNFSDVNVKDRNKVTKLRVYNTEQLFDAHNFRNLRVLYVIHKLNDYWQQRIPDTVVELHLGRQGELNYLGKNVKRLYLYDSNELTTFSGEEKYDEQQYKTSLGSITFDRNIKGSKLTDLFINDYRGIINLFNLPDTVRKIVIKGSSIRRGDTFPTYSFTGNIGVLPEKLKYLEVESDSLIPSSLPPTLTTLILSVNKLRESPIFDDLPSSLPLLRKLVLRSSSEKRSPRVTLSQFPPSLKRLTIYGGNLFDLSLDNLRQSSLEYLEINDDEFNKPLEILEAERGVLGGRAAILPQSLKTLKINSLKFDQSVDMIFEVLKELSIISPVFNQYIDYLPEELKKLHIKSSAFDQKLKGNLLEGLETISLEGLNQFSYNLDDLPGSLKSFSINARQAPNLHSLNSLPDSLESLEIKISDFNAPIFYFPESLKSLVINSNEFNQSLSELNKSLKFLTIHSPKFNRQINKLPPSVQSVSIMSDLFNQPISGNMPQLKVFIVISSVFNQDISKLPNSLLTLVIHSHKFTNNLNNLPKNLENLSFKSSLYTTEIQKLPFKLKTLIFHAAEYNHILPKLRSIQFLDISTKREKEIK